MKLIQVNSWMGKLAPTLMKFLEQEQPGIITTQEIFNSENDMPLPNDIFNLGSRMRDTLGLEYTYFSPRYSIDVAGEEMFYGNLILSRWPLAQTETTEIFGGRPIFHAKAGDTGENAAIILQTAKVLSPQKEFVLANYHGYVVKSPVGYLGDANSTACAQKVAKKLDAFSKMPLIFSGDFNVSAESESMRVFDGKFRDLTAENHVSKTLSPAHRWNGPADCDHILVNDKIDVKNFLVGEKELVSDHLPLIMEFGIK